MRSSTFWWVFIVAQVLAFLAAGLTAMAVVLLLQVVKKTPSPSGHLINPIGATVHIGLGIGGFFLANRSAERQESNRQAKQSHGFPVIPKR